MKQIAQNYRSGELVMLDVPAPACRPGGVLVRNRASLISAGTELMKISESRLSLIGKARARPDQVKRVVQSVTQQGLAATYRKVSHQLDSYTPLGYSTSGVVVEVGEGVTGLEAGQRVACGGNQFAHHAEFNWVPIHLCAAVPDAVSDEDAAYTTVGAIALHGCRRSEAVLGETACVIGLGLVGQLLVQILVAGGVQVVGVDPSPTRCALAERLGARLAVPPGEASVPALLAELSSAGVEGADHVFLAAGSDTNEPVEMAALVARDRGRVTDIGKCRLDLPWNDYYAKELEIRFSRSYGPGRYDPRYEEGGVDYPAGYVRWTEQRNMGAFLRLVETGRIDVGTLTELVVPFFDAVATYERIRSGSAGGVGVLFSYNAAVGPTRRIPVAPAVLRAATRTPGPRAAPVRIGVIGAGNYAATMLLPHLSRRDDVTLVEVATVTGLSARNALRKFGFQRCSTDPSGLVEATDIDAVIVATRHATHAPLAAAVLTAGKALFVEKPLAIDAPQLEDVRAAIATSGNDRLVVGYNRRFAPLLTGLQARFGLVGPVHLRYDVNAGRLAPGSWYSRPDEAGTRLVGEGCHFVDTASWWIGADPVHVAATSTPADPDDVVCTLHYPDGSVATISYLTGGDGRYPKETLTVFGGGRVARLQNFERAELWAGGRRKVERAWRGVDKGQRQELEAFVRALRDGSPMPISLTSLLATTEATLAAQRSLASGRAEPVLAWPPASPVPPSLEAAR